MPAKQIIRRITSKGQVTLPSAWRARITSDTVVFIDHGTTLEVRPAEVISGEEVLYDAVRDTAGKGILVRDLVRALKKDLKH